MVYQEGFRDPGQKSGFGSSQSLCPAPQWVVMAAPLPTPSGGCCPGRPCRVTLASTLFPEPAQAETKPPYLGRCVLRLLSHLSEHHSWSHPRPYAILHLETWDPILPGAWTKGPTLWQEKGTSMVATV